MLRGTLVRDELAVATERRQQGQGPHGLASLFAAHRVANHEHPRARAEVDHPLPGATAAAHQRQRAGGLCGSDVLRGLVRAVRAHAADRGRVRDHRPVVVARSVRDHRVQHLHLAGLGHRVGRLLARHVQVRFHRAGLLHVRDSAAAQQSLRRGIIPRQPLGQLLLRVLLLALDYHAGARGAHSLDLRLRRPFPHVLDREDYDRLYLAQGLRVACHF